MLIKREFWINLIEQAWQQKNIIWLMGVRRVGKTSLCQSLDNVEYLELPLCYEFELSKIPTNIKIIKW